jgi:hypothetical protein
VTWLWHNDRLQSPRSQSRYWDVWLDFFGYANRFENMPFVDDKERALRIANIIDAAPVKPWAVDARTANSYKIRLENETHTTGRQARMGKRGKLLQPDTRKDVALSPKSIANAIAVLSSYYAKAGAYPIYHDTRMNKAALELDYAPSDQVENATSTIHFNNMMPGSVLFSNSWMQHQLVGGNAETPTQCVHFIISHKDRPCSTC